MKAVLAALAYAVTPVLLLLSLALLILLPGGAVGWGIHWFVPSVEPGSALLAGMMAWTLAVLLLLRGEVLVSRPLPQEPQVDDDEDFDDDETDSLNDDEVEALRELARAIIVAPPAEWVARGDRRLPEAPRRKRR